MRTATIPISLIIILALLSTLPHIVAEIYVPAMPTITTSLASTPTTIQFTLTAFMFGLAFSQLFYGPLSDRIGRRTPILLGVGLTIVGSLFCLFSTSASIMIFGRFIQGLGVGACNSVPRALSRDILSGNQLAKLSSQMSMITVLMIASSPALGGYILHYLGWHAVFIFLVLYNLFIWSWIYHKLPETNQHLNLEATKISVMIKNYFILLKNKSFLGFSICASCPYAGIMAFITSGPFLMQSVVGLTPVEYGWLSFCIAIPIFFSSLLNSYIILEQGIIRMIFVGSLFMLAGGVLMLLLALSGHISRFTIMLPVSIFSFGAGLTFGNAFAGAMYHFPKMAGSSGALFGCLQIFGGSLVSALMAILPENDQIPLAIVFTFLGLLSLFCLKQVSLPKIQPTE